MDSSGDLLDLEFRFYDHGSEFGYFLGSISVQVYHIRQIFVVAVKNQIVIPSPFFISLLIGNLFVFFAFQDKKHIDSDTRTVVYNVLTVLAILGILLLFNLGKPTNAANEVLEEHHEGALEAVKDTFGLFKDYRLLLLCFSFWGTGKYFPHKKKKSTDNTYITVIRIELIMKYVFFRCVELRTISIENKVYK